MSKNLVLVPGLASDTTLWARTIEALGGSSTCTVGDTLRDAHLADIAKRILEQAPPRFALAGVSMGGIIALEIMSMAPARVTRLALVDTIAAPDTPVQRFGHKFTELAAKSDALFALMIRRSVRSMVHPATPPGTVEEIITMSTRLGQKVFARQVRAIAQRRDLRPVLSTINVPTAIIIGSHDTKTPLVHSEELANGIQGATLDVIPECGHLSPIEQPRRLANLLRSLLVRS